MITLAYSCTIFTICLLTHKTITKFLRKDNDCKNKIHTLILDYLEYGKSSPNYSLIVMFTKDIELVNSVIRHDLRS